MPAFVNGEALSSPSCQALARTSGAQRAGVESACRRAEAGRVRFSCFGGDGRRAEQTRVCSTHQCRERRRSREWPRARSWRSCSTCGRVGSKPGKASQAQRAAAGGQRAVGARDRAHAGVPPRPAVAGVAQQRQPVGRRRQARRTTSGEPGSAASPGARRRVGRRAARASGRAASRLSSLRRSARNPVSKVPSSRASLEGRRAVVVSGSPRSGAAADDRGAVERTLDLVERRGDTRPRREHQQALVLAEQ